MNALEKLRQGDLREAVEAAKLTVRDKPADGDARSLLCQLFCFQHDWERADKQFEILGQQHADLKVGVSLLRQLIRAEIARSQTFTEGRVPEVMVAPDEIMQRQLSSLVEHREGNHQQSLELISQALEEAPALSGSINQQSFESVRNLDDLTHSCFEILTTNGKYYWLPLNEIRKIEFRAPELLQDQIWRSANIEMTDGFEGEVYVPVRYVLRPDSHQENDDAINLGRRTDWLGDEAEPVMGAGQVMFLFGDEAVPILEIETLVFDSAEGE